MDPVTGAIIGGGASLVGSYMQNKANEKMAEEAAKQRAAEIEGIKAYGQRATESLLPAYQAAQNVRQQSLGQNLNLTGQTFRPMVDVTQTGDYMAQQAILAGLMGQRNAILGDPINYGALQAQSVPMDFSALGGLTNPQSFDFQPFEQVNYSNQGVMDWSGADASNYLAANEDVLRDYNANKSALLAGGDPQFATKEGYAKWHYDNYGRAEGRPLAPATQGAATDGPVFTVDQVRSALTSGEQP